MSKEKPKKLHKGQIDCIRNLIKSFTLNESYLRLDNFNEAEKTEESLFKLEHLTEHFSKYELGFFIKNLADYFLSASDKSTQNKDKLLSSDIWINSTTDAIAKIIESIPYEYKGKISLPAAKTPFPANLKISPSISIISTPNSPKDRTLINSLLGSSEKASIEYIARIEIKVLGYCDGRDSTAAESFLSQLKQLLGLSLILNLIEVSQWGLGLLGSQIIEKQSMNWEMQNLNHPEQSISHIKMPAELEAFIKFTRLNLNNLNIYADNPQAKTLLGRISKKEPENEAEFNSALNEKFGTVISFFNTKNSFDRERIASALEWFFEAKASNNQSVSLIFFCIGLETILSDGSESRILPLTEKLADRAAYILGKTQASRTNWNKRFMGLYKIRSNIVHARQARLSKQNLMHLGDAEDMLQILIEVELFGWLKSIKIVPTYEKTPTKA